MNILCYVHGCQVSSRSHDSLTVKVQMLHFSTKMGGPAPYFESGGDASPPSPLYLRPCQYFTLVNSRRLYS